MSQEPKVSTELHKLCGKLRDGEITEAESQRLGEMLQASPGARRFYRTFMALASALETRTSVRASVDQDSDSDENIEVLFELLHLEQEAEVAVVELPHQPRGSKPKPRRSREASLAWHDVADASVYLFKQAVKTRQAQWVAAAAVVALGVFLAVQFIGPSASPNPDPLVGNAPSEYSEPGHVGLAVATLTASHNATWAERALARGAKLHPGDRLTLTTGFAEITTARGAVAIFEAPCVVELKGHDNALHLHSGRLVGICETESSKGFVIKTDYADITDLGTEFGVYAHAEGVKTTVFTGEVEIETPAGMPERVTARQTATLAVKGNNRELVVEDQLAAGFEPLRDQQVVFATKLRGTGEGLSSFAIDPSWRITAVNAQSLENPIALRVSKFTEQFSSDNPDSLAPTKKLQYSFDNGSSDLVGRIETTLRLPESFDADRMQLAMRFRPDNELVSLKVNGQAVALPKQQPKTFNRAYAMVIDRPLQQGDNHFVFEVRNDGVSTRENAIGIQVVWELQPRTTK